MSDSELAVPAGMAAISVPARPVQAVGGSVEPGMEVDVYATGPVSTTKLVGGALVLATSAASESGATAEWVTLAVEPERVQEVVAAAQNLELYFALPALGGSTPSDGSTGEGVRDSAPQGQEAAEPSASAEASLEGPAAETPSASGQPAAPERWSDGGRSEPMTKRKRYLLCGHGEGLPIEEDGTTSLSSVLEELAVEVCAEAVSARRRVNEEHFDTVWVSCCEGAEPINLAAACKRDSPQTAVYLVTADRTGSVASRAQAAELDGIVSPAELGEHLLKEAARNVDGDRGDGGSARTERCPSLRTSRQALSVAKTLEANRAGFLLTVVSGSGGAGKSTVATLAALLGARRGLRTALLDADLQFGDLAALMGDAPSVPVEEIVRTGAVSDELREAPLVLVSAPRALERSEVVAASMGSVVDVLVASFDFVVANTGGGWDDVHLLLLERAAASLFLVDQRASSVRACRHALDLCLRCGIATGSFLLAVNRCTRHAPFTSIDVSSALDGAHVAELADGGREVEELLGAGMAQSLVEASSPLCISIEGVLDELLPLASHPASAGVQAPLARIGLAPKADARLRGKQRKRKGRASRREGALAKDAS